MRTERKVLRRFAALTATAAAAFFMGTLPAHADNGPHVSTAGVAGQSINLADAGQGRCASCHRAHTAQAGHLLVTNQESLCYSCHGTGGTGATTDVQDGVQYSAAASSTYPDGKVLTVTRGGTVVGALRGGGFDKAVIDTAHASKTAGTAGSKGSSAQNIPVLGTPVATTSNHLATNGAPTVMWGNGAISSTANAGKTVSGSTALECASCHDPHGNGNYRILKPLPDNATWSTGVPAPVTIADTSNKVYTTTNYWIAGDPNVPAGERISTRLKATSFQDPTPVSAPLTTAVSPFLANSSAWCTTCHTRYLANGAANSNSGDAVFTYRHTSDSVSSDAGTNRNCVQCHVAHGSNATMDHSNVNWPNGSGPSMDSRLLRADDRGVCVACHNV